MTVVLQSVRVRANAGGAMWYLRTRNFSHSTTLLWLLHSACRCFFATAAAATALPARGLHYTTAIPLFAAL